MKHSLLALLLALPLAAQTPTPTPPCCVICTPTPTPTPGGTPSPTAVPSATPTSTPSTTPVTPTPTPTIATSACILTSSPLAFEPHPPGVPRISTLSAGYSNSLSLYSSNANRRLLMQESFGYSVLDLTNPVNPTALVYHDTRFPLGGGNSLAGRPDVGGYGGDGQSDVYASGVSTDGARLAQSYGGPADGWYTASASASGNGFSLWGSFSPNRANSVLVQKVGNRYIAYTLSTAQDITTLPDTFTPLNSQAEVTGWPDGGNAILAGTWIVYAGIPGIVLVDASSPGPPGAITTGMPRTVVTAADWGGRTVLAFTAEVDPVNPAKVWILAELKALAGENSPSYALMSVVSGAKALSPVRFRVPSVAGETYNSAGNSAALIPQNGTLVMLMWSFRRSPSTLIRVHSTTVAAWGQPPGSFTVPNAVLPGQAMRGFASGQNVYAYLPTGSSAYVIGMVCK